MEHSLNFFKVNLENWNEFEHNILISEKFFPEKVRTPKNEMMRILHEDNIFIAAFSETAYLGNIFGYPVTDEIVVSHGIAGYNPEYKKSIYLASIVIAKEYQGLGYGKILMKKFIEMAREEGYDKLFGHFRPGASQKIIDEMGGMKLRIFINWEQSGEDYYLFGLDLRKTLLHLPNEGGNKKILDTPLFLNN